MEVAAWACMLAQWARLHACVEYQIPTEPFEIKELELLRRSELARTHRHKCMQHDSQRLISEDVHLWTRCHSALMPLM